jgi:oxalate decarboxylase
LAEIAGEMEATAPRTERGGKANPHRISLGMIEPVLREGGALARIASAEEFSILDKLSLRSLLLRAAATEAPHWHPNCAEIGYVLSGRAQLSVCGPATRSIN